MIQRSAVSRPAPLRCPTPSLAQGLRHLGGRLVGALFGFGGRLGDHVQDQDVRLDLQAAAGRQLQVAGVHRLADLHALDVDVDTLRDVRRLRLQRDLHELLVEQPAGEDLADDPDGHLDGDLLALPDQDQVDMLDDVLDRIPLYRLGQGDLAAAW